MLNSKQIITTEDLQTYSVCGYNPLTAYVVGNTVKDPTTGDLYKCIANAAANTPLTNVAFFSSLSSTGLPAASDSQALAKASSAVAITPSNLAALTASSADAITGTDTNKFLTAKSLADTLNNVATVGTNTKYGTLKTASSADALAGSATDKALTPSNIPGITASDVEAQAETITNKFLTPANLAAMQATDVEAKAMTKLKKFLTPKNLDALRAVLADMSDTAPLNNKFVTDEHLVDWFNSAGRVDTVGGAVPGDSSVVVQVFPGGKKLVAVKIVNPALAANQTALAKTYNFLVGLFSTTPRICIVAPPCFNGGTVFSAAAAIQGITATQITTSWGNPNAVAFGGSQVSLTVLLFGN